MLDPASEQFHHSKKQRERIYADEVYFTSSQPPKNTPEWACEIKYVYETDEMEYEEHKVDDGFEDYEIVSILWIIIVYFGLFGSKVF